MMAELGVPTAQIGGLLTSFFTFGVMFQLAGAMLAPFIQQVQNDVWAAHPDKPLSAPDLATATVRGIDWSSTADTKMIAANAAQAAENGFDLQHFQAMCDVVGMAPALELLFQASRRNLFPFTNSAGQTMTLEDGIKQSDIKDEWIELVEILKYVQVSPIDLVNAAVRNQKDDLMPGVDLSYWETMATELGLAPPANSVGGVNLFSMLYNVAGRPPSPGELYAMYNRGYITAAGLGSTELTVEQGIAESDLKDKWYGNLLKLAEHWPAAGEVGTLLREGGITDDQAKVYWKALGVPDELMAAYNYVSTVQQVTQDRALAKGDIVSLIEEVAITDTEAIALLQDIGYFGDVANYIVEMAHAHIELEALRNGVRNVSTMFTGHKITAAEAQAGLAGLGLPSDQITKLLATLDAEMKAEVSLVTAGQVASALYYGIISQATAMTMMEARGYPATDAWIALSVRMHGPLPNPPTGITAPSSGSTTAPVTGTGGPSGIGAMEQSVPLNNTVAVADVGTFSDQLVPTIYNYSPVTYITTQASPYVTVSPTGAITASTPPGPGVVYVSGTMSDANGDTGTWNYTLTFD
jgi:hypothetical protein